MNSNTLPAYIGGIVRILTAMLGGYLAKKGLATEADTEGLAGAAIIIATGIWSIWAKRKALLAPPPSSATPPIAPIALIALIPLLSLLSSGCAVVSGKAGESRYTGFALGEKASSTLAGLNVTETKTEKGKIVTDRGVGIDQAGSSGQADVSKILGNLLLIGLQSQGLPAKASAASQEDAVSDQESEVSDQTSEVSTDLRPLTSSYSGAPSSDGSGVYGRPTCSRCRSYAAAHPDTPIIDLDIPANRAAMWATLRRLGYTGTVVNLPVQITPDSYASPAK